MNPMALLFALLSTIGAASALSGGRRRDVSEDDDGAGDPIVGGIRNPDRDSGSSDDDGDPVQSGGSNGGSNGGGSGSGGSDPVTGPVKLPDPPVQSGGTGTNGGGVEPTPAGGDAVTLMTGRVKTLDPEDENVASVRILSQPAHGHVSVNPDNTFAVVLTETQETGAMSFKYEVTHTDGTTSVHSMPLNVTAGIQEKGWGTGESHYMLEVDENDRVIVEHGDNHRAVYMSNSDKALSIADIAAREGLTVDKITGSWLAARPEYGSSEGLALAPDAGMRLWSTISGEGTKTSNWLLLERGYAYDGIGKLLLTGSSGEDELHPLYFGAWGEGDKPEIMEYQKYFSGNNVVFQDIHFADGVQLIYGKGNILLDNVTFTGDSGLAVQQIGPVTVHNSAFYDIHREETVGPNPDLWDSNPNRISGLFAQGVDGLLIDGSFFDHVGWVDGYRVDASTDGPQPPNKFSQNIYIQWDNDDVTLRDTISMRAASYGAQIRSGGFIDNNLFLDNNAAFAFLGGNYGNRGPVGHYSLVTDNISTSAGYKDAMDIGALNWGMGDGGQLSSIVDNIVAHMADPNNPDEIAAKPINKNGHKDSSKEFYNDTVVWNWGPAENTEGLDPGVLDQTTIQRFTEELLGKPGATINDLANYLRAQADGAFDDVVDSDLIVRFFQSGFGIAPDIRTEAGMVRFIPNELGEGVRWDNQLNWSSGDMPGSVAGDSVDLGGNKVIFGGTAKVDELEFGANGGLRLEHGKLTVEGGMETGKEGATLDVNGAGQIWTDGGRGTGELDIDVTGGRFANTGDFRMNADLTASGGQTLLGVDDATYAVTNGSRLEVVGDDAKVGFDGQENGIAILGVGRGGTLAFTAEDGKIGSIEEFRSGALGDDTRVMSGVDLGSGKLELDLTELVDASGTFTLVDVDELIGGFGSTNITGLGSRNAEIVIDYETDSVQLKLAAGSGAVKTSIVGNQSMFDSGEDELWNALTAGKGTYDDERPAEDDEDYLFDAA